MNRHVLLGTLVAAALVVGVLLVTRRSGSDAASRAPVPHEGSREPAELVGAPADAAHSEPAPQESHLVRRKVEEAVPETAPDARPVSRRRPGSIVVQIVYPDGAPAVGAAVWHVDWGLRPPPEMALTREEASRRWTSPVRHVLADRDLSRDLLARHYVADDEGYVYPSLRVASSVLSASSERDGRSYRGSLGLEHADDVRPGAEHRVVMQPMESFRVRVVDPDGNAIPRVPVAIVVEQGRRSTRREVTYGTATADDEGLAVLGISVPSFATLRAAGAAPRIVALLCGDPLPAVPLAADATLVVPRTGTLVVEFPGAPPSGSSLHLTPSGGTGGGMSAQVRDGRAEFAPVALDATLDLALVIRQERLTERVTGPTTAQPMIVHRWQTALPHAAWTFTLRDETGEPIRERRVLLSIESDDTRQRTNSGGFTSTDADGRGAFRPAVHLSAGTTMRFLTHDAPFGAAGRRPLAGTALLSPDAELGDIVLTPLARLASGRVVDRDDEPIADADVTVSRAGGNGGEGRTIVARGLSLDDGTYEIWGEAAHVGPLEIAATARGYLGSRPTIVRADDQLVIRLDAAASLRFSIRTPEGLRDRVSTRVVLADDSIRRSTGDDDRDSADVRVHHLDGLPPVAAQLVVQSIASGEPLVERDIVLVAGSNELGEIDLTDALPWFRLALRAESADVPVVFSIRYDGVGEAPLHLVHHRPALLPRPLPGRTITVFAGEFRPATVVIDREDVTVDLEPGAWAVVRLPRGYPRPPVGTTASLWFTRRDEGLDGLIQTSVAVTDADVYRVALDAPGSFSAHLVVEDRLAARVDFELTAEALENGAPVDLPFGIETWTEALETRSR